MPKPEVERFMTLHPEGKQGVNIEKAKYEDMRRALLRVVPAHEDGIPFREVSSLVGPHLDPQVFKPSDSRIWYVIAVKQDLEARGLLEKIPKRCPQRMRRTRSAKA